MKRQKCCKGLHDLTPGNVWTRPSDGRRYCRLCKDIARRKRELGLHEQFRTVIWPLCDAGIHPMQPSNRRNYKGNTVCLACTQDTPETHATNDDYGFPIYWIDDRGRTNRLTWSKFCKIAGIENKKEK